MVSPTGTLREEHEELLPLIEAMRTAADTMEDTPLQVLKTTIDDVITFLGEALIPHATAEDAELNPVIDRLLGPQATATMTREHAEIVHLTEQLRVIRNLMEGPITSPAQMKEIRTDTARVLYALHAIAKLHFAKEEEFYLPVLDERLSAEEAAALFTRMGRAGVDTRAHAA
jgi:hemerythrin-like domain-containing protein